MKNANRAGRGIGLRLRVAALLLTAAAAVVGSGLDPTAGAAASVVPQAASSAAASGDTVCAPSGEGGTTCTGTYSGDTAWNPQTNQPTGLKPTVTVDQTTGLDSQIVRISWTNFTPSLTNFGAPFHAGYARGHEYYPVYVFQCDGTDPVTDPNTHCNGVQPGAPTTGAPGTEQESYTQTGTSTKAGECAGVPAGDACGTGYIDFQVQTQLQNSALQCDSSHPCSIVVVPVFGGNNFVKPANCTDHSGDLLSSGGFAEDSGNPPPLGGTCENDDEIVVPISFAPTPKQFCSAAGSEFSAQGSPLLERTMTQWQPGWCTASSGKVDFNYDSAVNEYQARSGFLAGGAALSSSTDVALVTDPASSDQQAASSRQYTYAPVATTGISIAYYVDNEVTDQPITDLKLDARLVAKLLTQSYAVNLGGCPAGQSAETDTCDPAVAGNPNSIFDDPEFKQLNPQYTSATFADVSFNSEGAFLPVVLAGDSDMTYELTRWVESDADARAFLEGEPDPWGMHVNAYYEKGQTYPISQFQIFDPGFSATQADLLAGDPWLSTMQVTWNPVTGLDNVAAQLAGWTPSGDQWAGTCPNNGEPPSPGCAGGVAPINPKDGAEQFPQRALFAIMDSGTAAAFRFPTAQLVNPAGDAIAPTTSSMNAAVGAMATNPDGITQYQNYANTVANAYPLTEVQYAMVPTCGLSPAKSAAVSAFLQDVRSSQTYGVGLGQIPPFGGYLTLNAAQKAQVAKAATAVRQQTCTSPPPDTTVSGGKPPAADQTGGNGDLGAGLGGGSGTGGLGNASPGATTTSSAGPSARVTASPSATAVGLGDKAADSSSDMKYILPAALAAGALLAVAGPLAFGYGTGGGFAPPFPPFRRRRAPAAAAAGDGAAGDGAGGDGDGSGSGADSGDGGAAAGDGGLDG